MAVSSSCCLNLSAPPPLPPPGSTSRSKTSAIAWPRREEGSWRRQCAVGVACLAAVMSLDMGSLTAMAEDLSVAAVGNSGGKVERWSDKRMCPAWRTNSLETIVPENLPRPSARRRYETVAFPTLAPPLTADANSCFSM